MVVKGQGSVGKIVICDDFTGNIDLVANTATSRVIGNGSFKLHGQGIAEVDSGAPSVANKENGVIRLTTTDEAAHAAAAVTDAVFKPSVNGTVVLEARVSMQALTARHAFIGFSDVGLVTAISPATGSTVTITLADSDLIGFLMSSTLTAATAWHAVHNGGSSTGVTVSTSLVTGEVAVAAEMDVLRIEIDTNGTGRWYINGELVKTLAGAVAPTVALGVFVGAQATTTTIATLDVDYIKVTAARDWTA
jgi:hypothetical protein